MPAAGRPSSAPRVLVTAGPTREPIDAVRYLSNRSSGRMGVAIALESARRGWPTTLLLGPVDPPAAAAGLRIERFDSTADLEALLRSEWPLHDLLVMAAAVADHRPRLPPGAAPQGKMRRSDGVFSLEMEPTPDLLAALACSSRPDQVRIGFALEPPDRLAASAAEKLARKSLDAIVANPLETMDAATVEAALLLRDGRTVRPHAEGPLPKPAFAAWLLDRATELRPRAASPPR